MNNDSPAVAEILERTGERVIRYGLVLVIFWIGCLKFTDYESKGVFAHASNSPLLSWAYQFLDVRNFSRALGTIEITLAVLIATRPLWPKVSAIGSLGAIAMFLTTLSFLLTTPGVWQPEYGFPSLSGAPGQFLVKDVVLLGAAIWTAGEALLAAPDTDRSASMQRSGSSRNRAA
ncbi:MAG: YkgB family protein [Bryobacteraceae bacterium]